MGLLGDVYSYSDGLKRKLRGLLDDPAGTLALGVERLGEDQRGLLNTFSNAYPMAGDKTVLNSPQQIAGFRQELGDSAASIGGNMAGMIKTQFGKIPETSKEIDAMADYFRTRGEALGHNVDSGASNVSGSRYLTFKGNESPDLQVRLSNHGDRYPNQLAGAGERFSVDPDSGNTFEMAKNWLKDNGVNLSARVTREKLAPIDDATLEKIVGLPIDEMKRRGNFEFFKNKYVFRPDGTVGNR